MIKKRNPFIHLQYSDESTADLRGRQSVRTTFKLSERCIEALSILAGQMGIKQKSLFDHLIDDIQALKAIASEFEDFSNRPGRVAKTYVISRRTLENLERISTRYATPRDALVELSIERLLPLVEREKKQHAKRKVVLQHLEEQVRRNAQLLRHAEKLLGQEDPVFHEVLEMVRSSENSYLRIVEFLEKSKKIEDF